MALSARAPLGFRSIAIAAGLAVVLAGGIVASSAPEPAAAITGSDFDPGYIISDAQFYAGNSMTEAEIQNFLVSHGPASCLQGYPCLWERTFDSYDKPANPMCKAYVGAKGETTARIIAKVGLACSISPKVLLVMLQKEQGLITDNWPTESQLKKAMGAGCPDTAACDPALAGFFTQVYFAAYYLIRYGGPPGTGPGTPYNSDFSYYGPGKTVAIQYNPNVGCGTKAVYIRNQPTASLYTYTPYTPNAAALANLGGTGDACSAYGNRNFWVFYSNWFGNPAGISPTGVTVSRVGGANRYETSTLLSQSAFSTTGGVVYIARGDIFPDALSAAPSAIVQGAPILLIPVDSIPASVVTELQRLQPSKIVVVGQSITDSVVTQLGAYAPTVRRDGGADRFETSRIIATNAFPTGSTLAYVVTGRGFPDALSASAAAGHQHAPIILVDGAAPTIDQATSDELVSLGVTHVIVAGSSVTVSTGIEAALATVPGVTTVTRMAGRDRFDTASQINAAAFTASDSVYLADAYNFPDALAGAAVAGAKGAPVYLSPSWCTYRSVINGINSLHTTKVIILGQLLSRNVEEFVNCD
jgi:putative cell wall-binding protein